MAESLQLRGVLKGHTDWVTALATAPKNENLLVSASRDKTVIVWDLSGENAGENFGVAKRSLVGHSHFVEDIDLTSDGRYVISASWDRTCRLWEVETGATKAKFRGHTDDVLSVAFSPDNRKIITGSRDKTIRLWNTIGDCRLTIGAPGTKGYPCGHDGWVSSVVFTPTSTTKFVTVGHDDTVKVFDLESFEASRTLTPKSLRGHSEHINAMVVSPDSSLCATGGKDCKAILWNISDAGVYEMLYSIDTATPIHALVFSPNRFWLVAATEDEIIVLDLAQKETVDSVMPKFPVLSKKAMAPHCRSLCWSADGSMLFAGFTDSEIRVYEVVTTSA